MPIKSKAQRRKFAELLVDGKISPKTFEEWNRSAGDAELPERLHPKAAARPKRKASPKRKARSKPKSTPKRKATLKRKARVKRAPKARAAPVRKTRHT